MGDTVANMEPVGRGAVYVHAVWATWERLPLLAGDLERAVHRGVAATATRLNAEVVAVGGVEDHVHLLVRLPNALSVATLLKNVKGASAHLVTHELAPSTFFKWQPGYGSVSVSPRHLAQVAAYIAHQREHHATGTLHRSLEDIGPTATATTPPTV